MQKEETEMKGIIFDFNGTMFFDADLQERAWRMYLGTKIGREVTDEEFQQYVHGRNADISIPYFMNRTFTREEIDALSEEKEAVYRQLCYDTPERFHLAEGLPEFLDFLKAKGLKMTIATASALKNVRFYFDSFDLTKWFNIEEAAYDDGTVKGKPEPDLYIRAMQRIGVSPEHCMVFEDATAGLIAALRAGAGRIVGVASMLDEAQLFAIEGVDHVIPDYRNAAKLLDEQN